MIKYFHSTNLCIAACPLIKFSRSMHGLIQVCEVQKCFKMILNTKMLFDLQTLRSLLWEDEAVLVDPTPPPATISALDTCEHFICVLAKKVIWKLKIYSGRELKKWGGTKKTTDIFIGKKDMYDYRVKVLYKPSLIVQMNVKKIAE